MESTGGLLSVEEGTLEPGSLPGLEILDRRGEPAATWSAVPTGSEAAPLLELLTSLCRMERDEYSDGGPGLKVLVAPGCPNCPNAVRTAVELLTRGLVAYLHVVDVTAFQEEVEELGVTSVPVTALEGLVLTGVRSAGELAGLLRSWGTPAWTEHVLASHLDEARVEAAASLLVDGSGVTAFSALWARSSLATRLGLMLAAQTALERAPRALDGTVATLVPLLESGETALRGDTAELLGWIGHPSAVSALHRLANDPDPELAGAAAEALENLTQDAG